ncbi:hypothetical protein ABT297_02280 [Dactylosporangium sp. NPDC000555]|uniref:hypothetical protein n=1 Tax=Dactylosporangium sp. NPDC000555 TaxID=3154260 RepID=UPI00332EA47F
MFAVIAAILFAVALLIDLLGAGTGPVLDVGTLSLAGFLCIALHMAGAGAWTAGRFGARRRRYVRR